MVFKDNGTVRMTTTKGYDNLNRLTLISNVPSASAPWIYAYQYNNANQRTQMNLGDGSYWKYGYDSLGQVTSGKRQWSDNSYVAGQQYEYTFNDIGDRTLIKNGGDSSGSNLRSVNYYYYSGYQGANLYSARDIPSSFDVTGMANASASVTVNGQAANRKNEYYQASISVSNVGTSLYPAITVTATLEGASQSQTGNVFVPGTAESFTSDDDGNLLTDRHWTNTWDGENRLIAIQANSYIPDGAKKCVEFDYDYQGRRTKKRVYNWDPGSSSYLLVSQREFIYDGWNLLAELNNGVLARSYVWGADASGGLQGAGGVGGLVAVKPASGGVHFPAYDGNGNMVGLVDASNGTASANYEYGPFGEPIRVTGTMGKANPFRFSTHYTDDETDLVYAKNRYYNPSTGRWLSRDPVVEQGGLNLYGFVDNNPIDGVDPFGLHTYTISITAKSWIAQPIKAGHVNDSPVFSGLRLAVVMHGIEKSTDDNVTDDALNGRYRLLSQRVASVDCCGNSVSKASFSSILTDVGLEGFGTVAAIPPEMIVTDDRGYQTDKGSVRFTWMAKGRPDPKAEILMNAVSYRSSVYIWHRVIGSIKCSNGKPVVTLKLENSRFPSADLFYRIDGGSLVRSASYAQGTMSLLWNADPLDPTLVQ